MLLQALGNIFNFLVSVNAAGNFLLYCLLSDKYRRVFVRTLCRCCCFRAGGAGSPSRPHFVAGKTATTTTRQQTMEGRGARMDGGCCDRRIDRYAIHNGQQQQPQRLIRQKPLGAVSAGEGSTGAELSVGGMKNNRSDRWRLKSSRQESSHDKSGIFILISSGDDEVVKGSRDQLSTPSITMGNHLPSQLLQQQEATTSLV